MVIGRPATPQTQEGVTRSAAVDADVAGFPPEVADRLAAVRATLAAHLGGGEEVVRYGLPAVMLDPRHGLHVAGWKKHVALYPVPVLDEPPEAAVAPYRSSKDGAAFRHSQDLPVDLVGRICDALVRRWATARLLAPEATIRALLGPLGQTSWLRPSEFVRSTGASASRRRPVVRAAPGG